MARPYSEDLRLRVLAACDAHEEPFWRIAKRFQVGEATLHRWRAERAQEGRTTAKPHGGGPATKLSPEMRAWLAEQVRTQNDRMVQEYTALLRQEHGVEVDRSTAGRALRKLGLARKERR